MKLLSDRLKQERKAAGLTQEQIADAAKVTKQAISKLEGPQGSKNPNAYTLERISRRLGLNMRWLLEEKGPKHTNDTILISRYETPEGYTSFEQLEVNASAGAGGGGEVRELQTVRKVDVLTNWAHEKFGSRSLETIKVLTARGDCMTGAGINNGDLLFVDTAITRYAGTGFYVFTFRDSFEIKRMQSDLISQQLELVSFAASGCDIRRISSEEESVLFIQGKVLAWWTMRTY